MNQPVCQIATASGPCRYVAVFLIHSTIPPGGYPDGHSLGCYEPGEHITSWSCIVHRDGAVEAMTALGLLDVHLALIPAPVWINDGANPYQ